MPFNIRQIRYAIAAADHGSFYRAARALDIEQSTLSRAILASIDNGEIDIAILMGAISQNGFRCEPFWSERMLVALPASHLLAERDVIHWTDLRNERFMLPVADPGSEIRDMLLGRLAASGVKPDIRMLQSSRDTVLSIIGDSSAVSIICEGSTGARYPEVVYRPIYGEQGPALTGHSGFWRHDNNNPALRRFLDFIKIRYALSFDFSCKPQNAR